jgi:hypothetical protein
LKTKDRLPRALLTFCSDQPLDGFHVDYGMTRQRFNQPSCARSLLRMSSLLKPTLL